MNIMLRAMAALWLCLVTAAPLTAQKGETSYHRDLKPVVLPIKPQIGTAPLVQQCPDAAIHSHRSISSKPIMPADIFAKPNSHEKEYLKQVVFNSVGQEAISKNSTEVDPVIGQSFLANEGKFSSTPPDNTIAISNSGFIVVADNETVEYYDDMGNYYGTYNSLYDFVGDTTASFDLADPKIAFDPLSNRFVCTVQEGRTSAKTFLHLLFSHSDDPRDGWYGYKLPGDTLNPGFWTDRPILAIGRSEIFVALTMAPDSNGPGISNLVWQIRKREALDSLPNLTFQVWSNVRDANGNTAFGLVPLSDGLGNPDDEGIWMVANEMNSGSHVSVYRISDTIGAPTLNISTQFFSTPPYQYAGNAKQLGTLNELVTPNCRIADGIIVDSTIHFVFTADIGQGYAGIFYTRLGLRTMAAHFNTWGLAGTFDYAYPSLAFYGVDKTEKNVMIGFLRAGETLYPQACVVNYDGISFSPNGSKIVKNGESYVDLIPNNLSERWGDYTGFARKFNSPNRSLWFVGQYGVDSNFWGTGHGYNAWIAEVLDTAANGIPENIPFNSPSITVSPNPTVGHFVVFSKSPMVGRVNVSLCNYQGTCLIKWPEKWVENDPILFEGNTENLSSGVYYLTLSVNDQYFYHEKIIINR